jgi:hypothetical protein
VSGRGSRCRRVPARGGFRYRAPVRDQPDVSYTELEFDAATEAGLPRLVFLLEPDAQGPDEMFTDRDHSARQESFRNRLRSSGLTVVMVSSPIQLDKAAFQAPRRSTRPVVDAVSKRL